MNYKPISVLSEIASDISSVQKNRMLYNEINFNDRADAVDFIDFHIIARIEALSHPSCRDKGLLELKHHAEEIKHQLEHLNFNLFSRLRQNIIKGVYSNLSFKKMVNTYLGLDVSAADQTGGIGYDNLDVFINGLLSDQAVPQAEMEREAEMVFYQKTPARLIFEMAERAMLNTSDVFADIGSGLGQAAMLINLISGCRAYGIEYEPAYCKYAELQASILNLFNVDFINQDAREADYSTGTVFFMYTPFNGNILYEVLQLLRNESKNRTIRLFTCGPCSYTVATQKWLNCLNGNGSNIDKLYEFVSL